MSAELYWSERGEVACGRHSPARGSDTWRGERWRRMTPAEVSAAAAAGLRCEVCAARERAGR